MRRSILGLVLGLALAYAGYGLLRHWHFRSSGYDLGIFDQAVWHYSRLERPTNTFSGRSHILAEHFHPILMLLAPLYWLLPRPEVLIVAQALLLAASVVPVFLYARRRVGPGVALGLSAGYGLFWGIQATAAFDFHELAFAPVLLAAAILGIEQRRARLLWPAALGLLLVREDLAPLVAVLGLWLLARRERVPGALLMLAGLASFVLIVRVIMPGFDDEGLYQYAVAYRDFGSDPVEIGLGILRDPGRFLEALVSPPVKLRTLFYWLAPFLFLPLLSPLSLLAAPLVLERFLSSSPNHWGTGYHYSAPIAPILAMAAADGLTRLAPRRRALAAGAIVVLCALAPGKQPLWRLLSPSFYRLTESERIGHRAVLRIPGNASVVAQDAIAAHLSRRDRIFTLRKGAPDADYLIASRAVSPWPNSGFEPIEELLAARRAAGYEVLFEEGDWVVLGR